MYEPRLSVTLVVWYREKLPGIMPLPAPIGQVRRAFIEAYAIKPSGPFSLRFYRAINALATNGILNKAVERHGQHLTPTTIIYPPTQTK
jgi:hypothetical protein